MQVSIISESGMNAALLGLGLSYGVTSKMDADAFKNPNITTVVNTVPNTCRDLKCISVLFVFDFRNL